MSRNQSPLDVARREYAEAMALEQELTFRMEDAIERYEKQVEKVEAKRKRLRELTTREVR